MNDATPRLPLAFALALLLGLTPVARGESLLGSTPPVDTDAPQLRDIGVNAQIDPFAKGQWYYHSYGSATFGISDTDSGDLYLGHVGAGYFFVDDWSINLEGVFGGIDPETGDADSAVGLDLLLRWHMLTSDDHKLSLFGEAGAGLIWLDEPFPNGGTRQNFTPQAGVGVMWEMADNLNLLGGVRWHHISNADKTGDDRNPGYDGVMIFAGLTCTW